jgi:FkbM family methyltransferase
MQANGHEMSIIAFWGHEGQPINWNGIQVFGKSFHPYAMDIMHSHSVTFKADAMISLMDAWVVETENLLGTRWIPWFPIDSEPLPQRISEVVKKAYARITMSRFGSQQMDNAGLDYHYVPHGVDSKVFKPLDQMQSREALKLPLDKFMVGMVAANKGNPPRKAFHQNIAAFAELKKKHNDCFLYLHTLDGVRNSGLQVALIPFIKSLGLTYGYAFTDSAKTADVVFADQYGLAIGYADPIMSQLYSAMDVHMLVSMGEGFGIPILEAQACGAPVIVGDWTAMSELCFSGWKVDKKDAEPIWNNLDSYQYLPHTGAIADKLEQAYRMRGNQDYRTRARDGAVKYDVQRVYEKYWKPALAAIEQQIQADKETIAKAKAMMQPHVHEWGAIGLVNTDGSVSKVCLGCDAENRSGNIIEDGFAPLEGLDFVPDTDGISKIVMREIKNDYQLDNLDITDGVIVDIGAHKGIVSCYLAKKYPQAKIYSFEPVAENYAALVENLKRNNITNVTAINKAVTKDGRGVRVTVDPYNNSGGANIYGMGERQVESITLDEIFKLYGFVSIDLLKIDCEGAEFEILRSANGLLKRVKALRGEFHRGFGDADSLLEKVRTDISDVVITMQG